MSFESSSEEERKDKVPSISKKASPINLNAMNKSKAKTQKLSGKLFSSEMFSPLGA